MGLYLSLLETDYIKQQWIICLKNMVWKPSYVQAVQAAPVLSSKAKGSAGDKTAEWCPDKIWATAGVD